MIAMDRSVLTLKSVFGTSPDRRLRFGTVLIALKVLWRRRVSTPLTDQCTSDKKTSSARHTGDQA
ncbi:hypothetical protein JG688_00015384 [Phytophthora aleatoria]|uniref:Uncharacterized protein n=1 Tax=Phytophthora aleatoria TaxID=2496075 RepID=A0A8J5IK20_9STRA|nr:hypothetical protein JG688_00015384 [Phytophthora aleatoria]